MMKAMSISLGPLLVAPALLWFEVMDKEPALAQRAVLYGILSVMGWLLSRKRWWLGLLILPVVAVFAWADVGELHDPFVGPAIVREAGLLHVLVWYALMLAGISIPVLAAAIMRPRKSL
jgi:hypothetical protein